MSDFGDLYDGFKPLLSFVKHTSSVKGFFPVDIQEENALIRDRKDVFLSWDSLGVYAWERQHSCPAKHPQISNMIRFPKGSPGFVTCVTYIRSLRVYLASALDMSFKGTCSF